MGIKHPLFWPFWYLHCKIKIKCLVNCKRILFRPVADSKYNENTTLVGKCLSTSATWPASTRVFSQRQWRQRRETLGTRLALRFYASGSFLQVIGDTAGVDKSTVSRVVTNVSNALIAKQSEFITWPTDAEVAEVKNSFYRRGGFPCVIGCVDGTHIRIQAPNEHENGYVNGKGFHSINVQGVCNHEGQY